MNMVLTAAEGLIAFNRLILLYIDPATTSYIIQIGVGVVIAVGTFLGIYRNKILRHFKKNKEEEIAPAEKSGDSKKEVITADDLMDDDE